MGCRRNLGRKTTATITMITMGMHILPRLPAKTKKGKKERKKKERKKESHKQTNKQINQ